MNNSDNQNTLKFATLWENVKLFLNRTKIAEKEIYSKIHESATYDNMKTGEFQQMYVMAAIHCFLKNSKLFNYTEDEAKALRERINAEGREKFAKTVSSRLQGQWNPNGTFFGEQAKFKWKRAPMQNGLAAVASPNNLRPYMCTLVHLPGYHIAAENGQTLGGIWNHQYGFIEEPPKWYCVFFSRVKTLKLLRTWELENEKQAQRHFEKFFLGVVYGTKYYEYRERLFDSVKGISSLTI
jgi:hypothetical protein